MGSADPGLGSDRLRLQRAPGGAAGQGPEASDGSISTLVSEGASASPPSPSLAATAQAVDRPQPDPRRVTVARRSVAATQPIAGGVTVAGRPERDDHPEVSADPGPSADPDPGAGIHGSRFRSRTGWTEPRSGSRRAGRSTSAWSCSTKELDQRQCTIVHSITPDSPTNTGEPEGAAAHRCPDRSADRRSP